MGIYIRATKRSSNVVKLIQSSLHTADKKILDVGCGKGELLRTICDSTPQYNGVGVDFTLRWLKEGRREARACNIGNVDFVLGDAVNLPVRDSIMDVALSTQLFEHLYDPKGALNDQVRVIREGGTLIIQQSNLLSFFAILSLVFLYPVRTRGKRGGLRWLVNRHRLMDEDSYYKYPGKDEDIKSMLWWIDFIQHSSAELVDIYSPLSKRLKVNNSYLKVLISLFSRGIIILATKREKEENIGRI